MKIPALIAIALIAVATLAQEAPAKKRIFITDSQSWETSGGFGVSNGTGGGAVSGGARPQNAELIKTFNETCPQLTVTIAKEKADYIAIFDHEGGKGYARKDNKIAVFNSEGDAVFSESTRMLGSAVKDACQAITKPAQSKK